MSDKKLLFKYLSSISHTKEDYLLNPESEECLRFNKEYSPYLVTRFLSGSLDTLMVASITNQVKMSAKAHYIFLLYSVRRRKRYLKYPKQTSNPDTDIVARYYGVSDTAANQYIKLLSVAQLDEIKLSMSTGGL